MQDTEAAKQGPDATLEGKMPPSDGETTSPPDATSSSRRKLPPFFQKVLTFGRVEEGGIEPLSIEERTMTRYINCFTIWCSMNANILP